MSKKKIKIKNISGERQSIQGLPAFEAGEVRTFLANDASRILNCPFFEQVEEPKKVKTNQEEKPLIPNLNSNG